MCVVSSAPEPCRKDIDEVAEQYVMGRLPSDEAAHFAYHCLSCRPCAAAAEQAGQYVRAMKGAAECISPRDRSHRRGGKRCLRKG